MLALVLAAAAGIGAASDGGGGLANAAPLHKLSDALGGSGLSGLSGLDARVPTKPQEPSPVSRQGVRAAARRRLAGDAAVTAAAWNAFKEDTSAACVLPKATTDTAASRCSWYSECLNDNIACGDDAYGVGYGKKYCDRFVAHEYESANASAWRDATLICLQQSLSESVTASHPATCNAIADEAFEQHVACYTQKSASICNICSESAADLAKIFLTVDIAEYGDPRSWQAAFGVLKTCVPQLAAGDSPTAAALSCAANIQKLSFRVGLEQLGWMFGVAEEQLGQMGAAVAATCAGSAGCSKIMSYADKLAGVFVAGGSDLYTLDSQLVGIPFLRRLVSTGAWEVPDMAACVSGHCEVVASGTVFLLLPDWLPAKTCNLGSIRAKCMCLGASIKLTKSPFGIFFDAGSPEGCATAGALSLDAVAEQLTRVCLQEGEGVLDVCINLLHKRLTLGKLSLPLSLDPSVFANEAKGAFKGLAVQAAFNAAARGGAKGFAIGAALEVAGVDEAAVAAAADPSVGGVTLASDCQQDQWKASVSTTKLDFGVSGGDEFRALTAGYDVCAGLPLAHDRKYAWLKVGGGETTYVNEVQVALPLQTCAQADMSTILKLLNTSKPALGEPAKPACCKLCRAGKACGHSCIAKDKDCSTSTPPGCACDFDAAADSGAAGSSEPSTCCKRCVAGSKPCGAECIGGAEVCHLVGGCACRDGAGADAGAAADPDAIVEDEDEEDSNAAEGTAQITAKDGTTSSVEYASHIEGGVCKKVCRKSKPCGKSCIGKSLRCHKVPGVDPWSTGSVDVCKKAKKKLGGAYKMDAICVGYDVSGGLGSALPNFAFKLDPPVGLKDSLGGEAMSKFPSSGFKLDLHGLGFSADGSLVKNVSGLWHGSKMDDRFELSMTGHLWAKIDVQFPVYGLFFLSIAGELFANLPVDIPLFLEALASSAVDVSDSITKELGLIVEAQTSLGMDLGILRIDVPASATLVVAFDPTLQSPGSCGAAKQSAIVDGLSGNGIFFKGELQVGGSQKYPLFGCPPDERADDCPNAQTGANLYLNRLVSVLVDAAGIELPSVKVDAFVTFCGGGISSAGFQMRTQFALLGTKLDALMRITYGVPCQECIDIWERARDMYGLRKSAATAAAESSGAVQHVKASFELLEPLELLFGALVLRGSMCIDSAPCGPMVIAAYTPTSGFYIYANGALDIFGYEVASAQLFITETDVQVHANFSVPIVYPDALEFQAHLTTQSADATGGTLWQMQASVLVPEIFKNLAELIDMILAWPVKKLAEFEDDLAGSRAKLKKKENQCRNYLPGDGADDICNIVDVARGFLFGAEMAVAGLRNLITEITDRIRSVVAFGAAALTKNMPFRLHSIDVGGSVATPDDDGNGGGMKCLQASVKFWLLEKDPDASNMQEFDLALDFTRSMKQWAAYFWNLFSTGKAPGCGSLPESSVTWNGESDLVERLMTFYGIGGIGDSLANAADALLGGIGKAVGMMIKAGGRAARRAVGTVAESNLLASIEKKWLGSFRGDTSVYSFLGEVDCEWTGVMEMECPCNDDCNKEKSFEFECPAGSLMMEGPGRQYCNSCPAGKYATHMSKWKEIWVQYRPHGYSQSTDRCKCSWWLVGQEPLTWPSWGNCGSTLSDRDQLQEIELSGAKARHRFSFTDWKSAISESQRIPPLMWEAVNASDGTVTARATVTADDVSGNFLKSWSAACSGAYKVPATVLMEFWDSRDPTAFKQEEEPPSHTETLNVELDHLCLVTSGPISSLPDKTRVLGIDAKSTRFQSPVVMPAAVTDIKVLSSSGNSYPHPVDNSGHPSGSLTKIPVNLNTGAGGKFQFLAVDRGLHKWSSLGNRFGIAHGTPLVLVDFKLQRCIHWNSAQTFVYEWGEEGTSAMSSRRRRSYSEHRRRTRVSARRRNTVTDCGCGDGWLSKGGVSNGMRKPSSYNERAYSDHIVLLCAKFAPAATATSAIIDLDVIASDTKDSNDKADEKVPAGWTKHNIDANWGAGWSDEHKHVYVIYKKSTQWALDYPEGESGTPDDGRPRHIYTAPTLSSTGGGRRRSGHTTSWPTQGHTTRASFVWNRGRSCTLREARFDGTQSTCKTCEPGSFCDAGLQPAQIFRGDPECNGGVKEGTICWPKECRKRGGNGCGDRSNCDHPPCGDKCCSGSISRFCSANTAPCKLGSNRDCVAATADGSSLAIAACSGAQPATMFRYAPESQALIADVNGVLMCVGAASAGNIDNVSVEPSGSSKLGACAGDCDNNDECAAGLTCRKRDAVRTATATAAAAADAPMPLCRGTPISDWDYCMPNVPLKLETCNGGALQQWASDGLRIFSPSAPNLCWTKVSTNPATVALGECNVGGLTTAATYGFSWQFGPGAVAATPCPSGKYQPWAGSGFCYDCSEGDFSRSGASDCTACPAGKWTNSTASSRCSTCVPGKYSGAGSRQCAPCGPGKYQDSGWDGYGAGVGRFGKAWKERSSRFMGCKTCPAGKYQATATLAAVAGEPAQHPLICKKCPAGKLQPQAGSVVCDACPSGQWSSAVGLKNRCINCRRGKYGDSSHALQTHRDHCRACPKGHFNAHVGRAQCKPCRPGSYAASTGGLSCRSCSGALVAQSFRARNCVPCTAGMVPDAGGAACRACSAGTFASGVKCALCPAGKYQNINGSATCVGVCSLGFSAVVAESTSSSVPNGKCTRCPSGRYKDWGAPAPERSSVGWANFGKWDDACVAHAPCPANEQRTWVGPNCTEFSERCAQVCGSFKSDPQALTWKPSAMCTPGNNQTGAAAYLRCSCTRTTTYTGTSTSWDQYFLVKDYTCVAAFTGSSGQPECMYKGNNNEHAQFANGRLIGNAITFMADPSKYTGYVRSRIAGDLILADGSSGTTELSRKAASPGFCKRCPVGRSKNATGYFDSGCSLDPVTPAPTPAPKPTPAPTPTPPPVPPRPRPKFDCLRAGGSEAVAAPQLADGHWKLSLGGTADCETTPCGSASLEVLQPGQLWVRSRCPGAAAAAAETWHLHVGQQHFGVPRTPDWSWHQVGHSVEAEHAPPLALSVGSLGCELADVYLGHDTPDDGWQCAASAAFLRERQAQVWVATGCAGIDGPPETVAPFLRMEPDGGLTAMLAVCQSVLGTASGPVDPNDPMHGHDPMHGGDPNGPMLGGDPNGPGKEGGHPMDPFNAGMAGMMAGMNPALLALPPGATMEAMELCRNGGRPVTACINLERIMRMWQASGCPSLFVPPHAWAQWARYPDLGAGEIAGICMAALHSEPEALLHCGGVPTACKEIPQLLHVKKVVDPRSMAAGTAAEAGVMTELYGAKFTAGASGSSSTIIQRGSSTRMLAAPPQVNADAAALAAAVNASDAVTCEDPAPWGAWGACTLDQSGAWRRCRVRASAGGACPLADGCAACAPPPTAFAALSSAPVACSCPHGTVAPNASCATAASPVCSACDDGYHVANGGAQCSLDSCSCVHGVPATGAACEEHGRLQCESCHEGYHLDGSGSCAAHTACSSEEFETTPGNSFQDRQCAPHQLCDSTELFASVAPTNATDRECALLTVCTAGVQYETTASTATSDRKCAALRPACTAGAQFELTAATATSDRACSAVAVACSAAQYEYAAPTASSDRACGEITACGAAQYTLTAATATSNAVCVPLRECNSTTQHETVAPTNTSDRGCGANICGCANGTAATYPACTEHGAEICAQCNAGFGLLGRTCVAQAALAAAGCDVELAACRSGQVTASSFPATNGEQQCVDSGTGQSSTIAIMPFGADGTTRARVDAAFAAGQQVCFCKTPPTSNGGAAFAGASYGSGSGGSMASSNGSGSGSGSASP